MSPHTAQTVAFVGWLVYRVPALLPVLQEHLEDNLGEVLPHVLRFGIRGWVERAVVDGVDEESVRGVIDCVREALRSEDEPLVALATVSFFDDLPATPHPAAWVRGAVLRP